VKHLGGPTWWPTVPMVLVTPLVTFSLLRRFVYD
jgi:NAD kinase